MKINIERLMHNIDELGRIGKNSVGGIDRWFGSETDIEARKWITQYWEQCFKENVEIDAIGNLWLKEEKRVAGLPILIGSHHDAVPCGGMYDGALGVLLATEIKQTIEEQGIELRHPLWLISFTGEEPNPFNVSTLGSKVLSGRISYDQLKSCKNRDTQETMEQAVRKVGGQISQVKPLEKNELAAFVECHIEQGHRLEDRNLPAACVTAITGIYREEILVVGESNHAGTTMMQDRKDAYMAACKFSLLLEQTFNAYKNGELVGTVGYVEVKPNEVNIIPGQVKIIVDIRTCQEKLLKNVIMEIDTIEKEVKRERGVSIERKVILNQKCVEMDHDVMKAIQYGIERTGYSNVNLESMAGHDAANMARICKTGMIFVKSVGGKSHCKEEYSTKEDINITGNAMLEAILKLDEVIE